MDVTLETLSKWFVDTLSPDKKTRVDAEKCLTNAADQPGYALALLRLASEPTVHDGIRKAAAVHFKNHLRARWAPPADPPGGRHTAAPSLSLTLIPDPEKEQIKALLVGLMLATSPDVQSQLSAALAVVGRHDFPRSWPSLLPELVASLGRASDYASINGILKTANTIFKKFRYTYRTNDLMLDLKYCLQGFQGPLLEVFLKTSKLIAASLQSPPEVLRPLIESQRLCCRIFYSLNFQDIPEFFEDHMKEWMTEFESYLITAFPDMGNDKKGVPVLDRLRAAICDNISLYMERYEEEFRDYLNRFASAVWNLLLGVSTGPARDKLTVTAIKFLTTVSTSVHHAIFSDPGTLTQICESIILPNVQLRDEDEEQFEFDHVEYIRRDIEGSDLDTRRRIACELLKGIATNYRDQVAQMVVGQIESMLSLYNQNPVANWKKKDCAIYLVIALATRRAGGSSATTDLVSVDNFFATVIVPELRSPDVNELPMLKADALKFFTTFRDQIQKSAELALIPDVIRFLGSESNVVHSYAANCIEKLLLVRDEGQPRYSSMDISPFLPVLMNNLFNALKFPNSEENPYVMKCIMRVFRVSDVGVEVAGICINSLTAILVDVCKNPKNPVFNHYLFEAIAALVRRSCERDPSLVQHFERSLFPVLQGILANDDSEFRPYTFQILAQLVELNNPPLPPSYMQLFEGLLNPEAWKRSGNVPGLVRLLQAYLQKAPHELNREGRLSQVLGIFNKLVSVSSTDELGFYVLNTVIENLNYDVVAPYIGHIWSALFTRLQNNRTVKFVKSLVIYMSLFLIKYGHERLVDSINAVQLNVFGVILVQFWIPHLKMITGFIELKLTSVAATRLICECPILLNDSAAMMWGKMLDGIITLIAQPEQERVEEEPDVPDIGENIGYSATFVHLYNAGKKEDDPLKEIRDPKEFLVSSLARLSALSPGKYPIIIRDTVDNANQQYLHQFCGEYNHAIL